MKRKTYFGKFGEMTKLEELILETIIRFPEGTNSIIARNIGTSATHVGRTRKKFASVIEQYEWFPDTGYRLKDWVTNNDIPF